MKKVSLPDANHCTGCGACKNACPREAVRMCADSEGFAQPVIDEKACVRCKLCERACPVLNHSYKNVSSPKSYAIMAKDEVREVSSSGGFFSVAAEKVLSQNGVVYGAAWTDDWRVKHIAVTKPENLGLIRSSKYVQSDTGDSYRAVKAALSEEKTVLYSGCPCQIAGLYGYLGKDYDKLYTAEIICHGVPSPKALQKYLQDNFENEEIESINFRDKRVFRWSTTSNIYFKNGEEYHRSEKEDSFLRAFLPCMILRRSCAVCPFSRLPRQADITMGDFWGSEKYRIGINDGKGLSAVLVNSKKGEKLFEDIKPEFTFCEEAPLDTITHINKTILRPFSSHPGRKHFFLSADVKPFNRLVDDSLNHHYDVGVVGLWYGINYGSILTYYALYLLLRDLGYDAVMLPRPRNLWSDIAARFDNENSIAQRFIWKHCNVFLPVKYQESYAQFNDNCDTFVLGSDVVWNYNICGKNADQFFFLDWVEKGHKKIAYASSCGNDLTGSNSYMEKAAFNLKQFDAISAREAHGVKIVRELSQRDDVEQVLDPVFMCARSEWEKVISKTADAPLKFVFSYLLTTSCKEEKLKILDVICSELNANKKVCLNPNERSLLGSVYPDSFGRDISVEEWLYHIKNASFYFGDSYHGLCFALIFHVPFLVLYMKHGGASTEQRFLSLLKEVGLEERYLYGVEDTERIVELINKKIDWNDVDARLGVLREKSRKWIETALKQKAKEVSAEDRIIQERERAYNRKLVGIYDHIEKLENDMELMKHQSRILYMHRARHYIQKVSECYKKYGAKYTLLKIKRKLSERLK